MLNHFYFHISPIKAIINEILPDCGYIIISSENEYDILDGKMNAIVLHFADTEDDKRIDAISSCDVRKILNFIYKSPYKDYFISCDAGESRSPAVVAGLLKSIGKDDSYIWCSYDYRPNILVYKKMLEAAPYNKDIAFEIERINGKSPEEYRRFRKA